VKVLIATAHGSIVGGAETYLRAVLPRLADAGFDIRCLIEQPGDLGVLAGRPDTPVWGGARGLPGEVRQWEPEVVYLHGLYDPRVEAELVAAFPTVLYAHAYYGTCVSGTKCHARRGFAPCTRPFGIGCLPRFLPLGCGGRNPLTVLGMYRHTSKRAALLPRYRTVLVASRHMAEEYRRNDVPAGRLTVLPYFPTDVARDPAPPAARPRSDRVLFVGRVTDHKGLDHLIEAVRIANSRLARRLTLVVAGDGPQRVAAETQARAAGVPTEFLGWVGGDRRTAEMRAADVLAVPSLWPEPFGLVGIEAGCVGLPAVGYASGGIADWLIPGVSGESAPGTRPDPSELADAVVRALADDAHWQQLRVGAWETAGRFSAAKHMTAVTAVLTAAAGRGSG
jgi:glycosyltransferase involved in cell wall biosynthesis